MDIVLIAVGYLLGSIPTAYLAARILRGVDLRHVAASTISGSAVYYHVDRWAIVPVGVIDVAKGFVPPAVALWLGRQEGAAVAAGLAAVIGHNWSPWLGLRGGRGLSPFMGLLLVLYPAGALLLLAALAVGRLFHLTPVFALLALLVLPGVIAIQVGRQEPVLGALGMVAITVLKRLEANRVPLPGEAERRWRVLWSRFWFDRDEPAEQS
jgi:glycerol-3-phosphate acyltransferase PlsY